MPYPYPQPQSTPSQSPTQVQGLTQAQEPTLLQSADTVYLTPSSAATSLIVVALALSLALGAFGYKKYHTAQRSRLLKRQVAMLEAMWRMSSTKRKF